MKKEKTAVQQRVDDMEFQDFLSMKAKKRKRGRQQEPEGEEVELLKAFWGEGHGLSEEDKFLRNYILGHGWKRRREESEEEEDAAPGVKKPVGGMEDREDERRDLEMEDFEEAHNFRFEEKNAGYVHTHAR